MSELYNSSYKVNILWFIVNGMFLNFLLANSILFVQSKNSQHHISRRVLGANSLCSLSGHCIFVLIDNC